jgi:hypothetical protein
MTGNSVSIFFLILNLYQGRPLLFSPPGDGNLSYATVYSAEVKNEWSYTSAPTHLYDVHRDKFTFRVIIFFMMYCSAPRHVALLVMSEVRRSVNLGNVAGGIV